MSYLKMDDKQNIIYRQCTLITNYYLEKINTLASKRKNEEREKKKGEEKEGGCIGACYNRREE